MILLVILSILLSIILFSVSLIQIIIPAFYLRYIKKMNDKNCKCSETFSRKVLKIYSIYVYVALILVLLCMYFIPIKTLKIHAQNEINLVINLAISFLLAFYLYTYATKMIKDKCKCANSWELKVMKYHSYLQFVLVFLASCNILVILLK